MSQSIYQTVEQSVDVMLTVGII